MERISADPYKTFCSYGSDGAVVVLDMHESPAGRYLVSCSERCSLCNCHCSNFMVRLSLRCTYAGNRKTGAAIVAQINIEEILIC